MASSSALKLPRASIPPSGHASIDLSLKELRHLSHRVAAATLPYAHELQLLERIYYKSKNQHRSALFWRKVIEVRRFASRVNSLDLGGILEDLRFSFHMTGTHNRSTKVLRSAWTHTPDLSACNTILRTFQSACLLVDKARVRFRVAYQSFAVQLRMATFLPLAVSLMAITSRLDFLLAEIRNTLPSQWEAVMRIVKAIDSASKSSDGGIVRFPAVMAEHRLPSSGEDASTGPRKRRKAPQHDEDLGTRVSRPDAQHLETPTFEGSSKSSVFESCVPNSSSGQLALQVPLVLAAQYCNVSTPIEGDVSADAVTLTSCDSENTPTPALRLAESHEGCSHKERPLSTNAEKKKGRETKEKRKRDEIDEIFGF